MNAHTDDDGVVVPCGLPDAMVQSLPQSFTTAVSNEKGEELGIKERAVSYHLRTLCAKGYIERIRQGVYRKAIKRVSRKNRLAA